MKKYIFISVLLLILTAGQSFGQIKLGIRAGISSSNVKVDDIVRTGSDEYKLKSGDPMVGFHFGLMSRIQLFNVYVQPELLFTSSGGNVKVTDINGTTIKEQKYNKLDIPVLAGLKFGPARIEVGPVASVLLSSKSDLITDGKATMKNATIGYQAGVGLDISRLAIDLKYEGNLSKLGDGVKIGSEEYNFDTRNSQIILSLGFFF